MTVLIFLSDNIHTSAKFFYRKIFFLKRIKLRRSVEERDHIVKV